MAKKKKAAARRAPATRATRNPQDATLRNVQAATRRLALLKATTERDLEQLNTAVEGLTRAHRDVTRRLAAVEHAADHLRARVTALDGQVGGGDEQTSLATAETEATPSIEP
jgi:predicted  nucleic acid-binding Zn-ribbon protein